MLEVTVEGFFRERSMGEEDEDESLDEGE